MLVARAQRQQRARGSAPRRMRRGDLSEDQQLGSGVKFCL